MKIIQSIQTQDPREEKKKDTFWATEAETCRRAIAFKFLNVDITNPISPESLLIMEVGKKIEDVVIKRLHRDGLLISNPDEQERIDIEREGVKISGKLDGMLKDNIPIEIKSFYGPYYEKELVAGEPKTSYLKQLAIYMDAKGSEKGALLHIDRGTGKTYLNWLTNEGNGFFSNGPIKIDLNATYRRWAECYRVMKEENLPNPDFHYKYPIHLLPELIKDGTVKKYKVSKARNGHCVLGAFQCIYCQYKDKCVSMQGIGLGYTNAEIEQLRKIDPSLKANKPK